MFVSIWPNQQLGCKVGFELLFPFPKQITCHCFLIPASDITVIPIGYSEARNDLVPIKGEHPIF